MLIKWTASAEEDLTQALSYLLEQGEEQAAQTMASRLLHAIDRLAIFPHSGRPGHLPDSRELIVPDLPYFAVYTVGKENVTILRVIHTSRLWR